jgi:hypothetical protein
MAHQQAVQNLQETIVEIAEHVDLANTELGFNPSLNPLGWVLGLLVLFAWIPALRIKE